VRRREHYWSLFHTVEKNQLDDLRTSQVEAVFAAIPKAQRKEWLIWKDGFAKWKPFDEFPDLLMGLRQAPQPEVTPPPAPPKEEQQAKGERELTDEWSILENEAELSLESRLAAQARVTPRYRQRFEFRAKVAGQVFQSHTVNISITGMQLAAALPENAPRYLQVELRLGTHAIPLLCSVVLTPEGKPSSRLRIEINDNLNLLQTLLLAAS
jgi:hypothetical protein